MRERRLKRNARRRFSGEEDLNPMNFVSNLADVMLILAVGIMLALIIHWEVPINQTEPSETNGVEDMISFSDDDLESMDELPDAMEKMGNVYYDPVTGKYYIIKDTGSGE
ncbi:MAG: hypothetical protein J5483_02235 [Lachnospiraceae bacterium]|nr:hypothetical protein [Lachnospiraceae bacterium]